MKNAVEVRTNHLSLVEKLPESREKEFTSLSDVAKNVISFVNSKDCKKQTYRMEVRTPDGKCLHYGVRATNSNSARIEANQMLASMSNAFQDERIVWRMAGDRDWSFIGAVKTKKSLWHKLVDYFFVIDEEEQTN